MRNRQEEIHAKRFNMINNRISYEGPTRIGDNPIEYNSIKTGTKILDDAVLDLGNLPRIRRKYANKGLVLKAIAEKDLPLMREISNYFYDTNGIYAKVCDYYAYLYRYDWYIVPRVLEEQTEKTAEKVLADFDKILNFLDNSHIKRICGEIASNVIRNGAYYGYIVPSSKGLVLQELPVNYCRTAYKSGDRYAVEFDMRFFDDCFPDINYRMKVLKLFPKEFQKGYILYKQGKIPQESGPLDRRWMPHGNREDPLNVYKPGYWYLLDVNSTVKFSLNSTDRPVFINAIPALLDLDAAQDLDRRKQMQDLLKIVIQKLPLDKNGDLIFDIDEAKDLHNNVVEMLQHAIGVDVVTSFADIKVESVSDSNTATTKDDLSKMERAVFDALGISKNIFNTDSNLALEKSILNDESNVRSLLLQFGEFFDRVTTSLSSLKKKYHFQFFMMETTQYNYKELSKMYKEQDQLGFSKMLPQIALGHSQSFIINTAYFENDILKLYEIMIPPAMSSTMSADTILGNKNQMGGANSQKSTGSTSNPNGAGRPEKSDGEKSPKTIANKESM